MSDAVSDAATRSTAPTRHPQTHEAHDAEAHGAAAAAATDQLHPRLYTAIVGLTAWFVLSIWIFAGVGVTDYLLFVVSGFLFTVVALSAILKRVSRADAVDNGTDGTTDPTVADPTPRPARSFHDWAIGNFRTWTGSITGREAAAQMLLPLAVPAFGMTLIGILYLIALRGSA